MQLQLLGAAVADHSDAAALDNVIELSRHRAQITEPPRGKPRPASGHATP